MAKIIGIAILVLVVAGSWLKFQQSGKRLTQLDGQISKLLDDGDRREQVPGLNIEKRSLEGERTFTGILLTFLTAGLFGIFVVTWLLPIFAQKLTHAVYDSGEEVEVDPFHNARVCMAQGEWEAAIEFFRKGAETDPLNRMPYVEIAKIQRVNMEDPAAALSTLREAIESQEWQEADAVFLMFRLAEIYDEALEDRAAAVTILEQVMEQFPGTRHSANARTKLHDWGMA